MKLLQYTALAIGAEAARENKTINVARKRFGSRVCGMVTGQGGHISDDIELRSNESCIFRIKPQHSTEPNHVHLTLIEAAKINCNEGQVNIVMGDEVFGPYCTEVDEQTGDRHRRGLWSSSSGMDMPANKEIDMVYTRTSGGGFKFSFNFEFEFELLPGLPGAGAQDDLAAQLGPYYKPPASKPSYTPASKPSYSKPSKPSYSKPSKPVYTKPVTTKKPTTTQKPTTKYTTTTRATTKYTTKATTKYTTPKPTTKYTTKYTTEAYDFFWQPDHSQYVSHPGPFDSSQYCPHNIGTWYNGQYNADCEVGICSTKYMKRCFNNVFNLIHTEICSKFRKQAKQAHTDIMNFFVELGVLFSEERKMACDVNIQGFLSQGIRGTVYQPVEDTYDRSAYHVGHLPYDDEDYAYYDSLGLESGRKRRYSIQPGCKRRAGVHACNAINYAEITTAQKYLDVIWKRIETTGKRHCNPEWTTMMYGIWYDLEEAVKCGN